MKDNPWPTISNFACGLILAAMAAMGLAMLLGGCAAAPPRVVAVPHVCAPSGDSPAYQKCVADCPDGDAFITEGARDIACFCRKPRDAM